MHSAIARRDRVSCIQRYGIKLNAKYFGEEKSGSGLYSPYLRILIYLGIDTYKLVNCEYYRIQGVKAI